VRSGVVIALRRKFERVMPLLVSGTFSGMNYEFFQRHNIRTKLNEI
jgi:hypothetical protein